MLLKLNKMEKNTQVINVQFTFQPTIKNESIFIFLAQQQLYENQISSITWSYKMLSTQKTNLQNNKSSKLLDLVQQDNVNKM